LRGFICSIAFALGLAAAPAHAETYRLNYEAAVLGVVVLGVASYEVVDSGGRYAVRANVRTSGLAHLFDQTQITATTAGTVSGDAVTWSQFDLSHAYAGKFRRIHMSHSGAEVSTEIAPQFRNAGNPPASAAQRAGSYDPLTAIFALGRQIGAARACRGAVLVFDGREHYRLSVSPQGQIAFNGGGYAGPALQCQFHYEPIAGFPSRPQHIPVAQVWFALPAQGGFAAPLRLIVPTPLGAGQVDLRSYQRN
jgi:uncharacterized protein DUF3108